MDTYCFLFLGLLAVLVTAKYDFSLLDCPTNLSNNSVSLENFTISPDPVEIPGNLSVSGIVRFHQDIVGNLSLELSATRRLGIFDLPLPCINGIGSCKYIDVCSQLDQGEGATIKCAHQLVDNGFPCTCPFYNGTYVVQDTVFEFGRIKGPLAAFAQGDYSINIKLIDLDNNTTLGCEDIRFTLTEPPVVQTPTTKAPCGFFCQLIG